MTKLEEYYFKEVYEIWKPLQDGYDKRLRRIIPFCTPISVRPRPSALVIGQNHSLFDPKAIAMSPSRFSPEERLLADNEADNYARAIPAKNFFLNNIDNDFVIGVRSISHLAGVSVDKSWVGTNRCAIQTGPARSLFEELCCDPDFKKAEHKMDELLLRLVDEIEPRNILAFGEYAAKPFGIKGSVANAEPRDFTTRSRSSCRVIPLYHPSNLRYWRINIPRVQRGFLHA